MGTKLTKQLVIAAFTEGKAARTKVPPGGLQPENPYRAVSPTLAQMWEHGYQRKDAARIDELRAVADRLASLGQLTAGHDEGDE